MSEFNKTIDKLIDEFIEEFNNLPKEEKEKYIYDYMNRSKEQ